MSNTHFLLLPKYIHPLWFHPTPSHRKSWDQRPTQPITSWVAWVGHLSFVGLLPSPWREKGRERIKIGHRWLHSVKFYLVFTMDTAPSFKSRSWSNCLKLPCQNYIINFETLGCDRRGRKDTKCGLKSGLGTETAGFEPGSFSYLALWAILASIFFIC